MRNDFTNTDSTTDDVSTLVSDMSISYVNVDYTDIDNTPTLAVITSPKHDSIGVDSDMKTMQVCVNMKARDLPDDDSQRAPIDIIVALDVSGSMSGSKLERCKKTLLLLLRVLYPEDRFGLICYAEDAVIEIPVQKMGESNKRSCMEKIEALRTRGCTNVSAAVGLAYQEMKQIETPGSVQTVFLLTDGHANAGIKDEKGLLEFTKNCFGSDNLLLQGTEGAEGAGKGKPWNQFQSRSNSRGSTPSSVTVDAFKVQAGNPISLHCFGFGTDHNSNLLKAMSNTLPGGSYYFVESDVDVGGAFGDALGGILSVVTQNVVVTLTVPEEAKARGVDIIDVNHDHKVKRENGSYTVVVGDFYAEESRDVLFEVKLAKGDGGEEPIAHVLVTVSYTDTLLKVPANAKATTCDIFRPAGAEISDANPHVDVQWTRVLAAEAMDQANEMARANDFSGARRQLRTAKSRIHRTSEGKDVAFRATLDSLGGDIDILEGSIQSQSVYQTRGSHTFNNLTGMHKAQRSMKTAPGLKEHLYSSKRKSKMMAEMSHKLGLKVKDSMCGESDQDGPVV